MSRLAALIALRERELDTIRTDAARREQEMEGLLRQAEEESRLDEIRRGIYRTRQEARHEKVSGLSSHCRPAAPKPEERRHRRK